MQPSDQDELRKQAQRAMQRRIDTSSTRIEEPPAQERQRRRQQQPEQRRRQETRNAEQHHEPNERRAREQQQAREAEEQARRRIEVIEAQAIESGEPMARTRRASQDSSDGAASIHGNIHSNVHSNIHGNIHGNVHQNVHATPYSRAGVRRRNQRIFSDLRDVEARRRAIVMAEILGKPVALRQPGDSSTSGSI